MTSKRIEDDQNATVKEWLRDPREEHEKAENRVKIDTEQEDAAAEKDEAGGSLAREYARRPTGFRDVSLNPMQELMGQVLHTIEASKVQYTNNPYGAYVNNSIRRTKLRAFIAFANDDTEEILVSETWPEPTDLQRHKMAEKLMGVDPRTMAKQLADAVRRVHVGDGESPEAVRERIACVIETHA